EGRFFRANPDARDVLAQALKYKIAAIRSPLPAALVCVVVQPCRRGCRPVPSIPISHSDDDAVLVSFTVNRKRLPAGENTGAKGPQAVMIVSACFRSKTANDEF